MVSQHEDTNNVDWPGIMRFYENYLLDNPDIAPIFWHKDGMPDYKKHIDKNDIVYKLNSKGLRCDELIKDHTGKTHILFNGCSITAGIGVNIEDTWAYNVYSDFKNTSGFFNISLPGGSIIEIIINTIKYVESYGVPNYIFILLPPIHRESRYIKKDFINNFIYNNYYILENYCKKNNITLLSTSWADKKNYQMLEQFKTFRSPDFDKIEYYGDSLHGDDNHHPGKSIHQFWYNQFKDRYENSWNK